MTCIQPSELILQGIFEAPFWYLKLPKRFTNTPMKIFNLSESKRKRSNEGSEIDFTISEDLCEGQQNQINVRENSGLLWHMRMGHASRNYLERAKKYLDEFKNINFKSDILDCEACALSKVHRLSSNLKRKRADVPLQVIHSDVMGPISPLSFTYKKKFIVTFIDDFTRYAAVYTLNQKNEVGKAFEIYLNEMRGILGKDVKVRFFQTDGGKEYQGYMQEILNKEKIELRLSEPDTPTHNGLAEKFNRSLKEKATAILCDVGMPSEFWDYAVAQAVYVYNRTPHAGINFQVPHKVFTKHEPRVNFLRRFGCVVSYRVSRGKGKAKFDPPGNRGILLNSTDTGYRVLTSDGKVINTKDVVFIENITYKDVKGNKDYSFSSEVEYELVWDNSEENKNSSGENKNISEENNKNTSEENNENKMGSVEKLNASEEEYDIIEEEILLDDDGGMSHVVERQAPSDSEVHALLACVKNDPVTFLEALESNESKNWCNAIKEELNSIHKNEAWELVERPTGERVIDSKWVFKRKEEGNGKIRFKARLVIRGFKDKEKYDLTETYAPVSRTPLVRCILSIAAKYNLPLHQMDVKTAFLNGVLTKPVYMEIPEGYGLNLEKGEKNLEGKVCKLNKALYGLRVSPKRWYIKFNEVMKKMNFEKYELEPCLYTFRCKDKFVFLLLYVDDLLILGNCSDKILETKRRLKTEFEMVDMGSPTKFLGMEIHRDDKCLKISQSKYVTSLLTKYCMNDAYTVRSPMIKAEDGKTCKGNWAEKKLGGEKKNSNKSTFREIVGSLLYLANSTRPDISFAVNLLCRCQSNPANIDWERAHRILQYLKGTVDLGLSFNSKGEGIELFTDASLGTNEDKSSTTGVLVKLFGNTIIWISKKQKTIALSSAEAEYIAMSEGTKEIMSLLSLIQRILRLNVRPAILNCDNKSAIAIAKQDGSPKLKHLTNLRFHFVKKAVEEKDVELKWVKGEDQLADFLTKVLTTKQFLKLRDQYL